MSDWYKITPSGPIAIGNLTPVGQNSGQVGCRWPPNGHQLAACLNLPSDCQLWGPFWYNGTTLAVPLPQTVYTLARQMPTDPQAVPTEIDRMQWRQGYWQVRPEHQGEAIEQLGGRYLIADSSLQFLWKSGVLNQPQLFRLPWQTLTLSHNRRQNFQVVDEGGFFAEMTTLVDYGWALLVRIIGNFTPPQWSHLGAGATPVAIAPVNRQWSWLEADCPAATGAVLLTGALWHRADRKLSLPYPTVPLQAYAADLGMPWQSWKQVRDRHNPQHRVGVLTPGEWLTPAGAVYLWDGSPPVGRSGPLPDPFQRHVLGYGHLWLFQEQAS